MNSTLPRILVALALASPPAFAQTGGPRPEYFGFAGILGDRAYFWILDGEEQNLVNVPAKQGDATHVSYNGYCFRMTTEGGLNHVSDASPLDPRCLDPAVRARSTPDATAEIVETLHGSRLMRSRLERYFSNHLKVESLPIGLWLKLNCQDAQARSFVRDLSWNPGAGFDRIDPILFESLKLEKSRRPLPSDRVPVQDSWRGTTYTRTDASSMFEKAAGRLAVMRSQLGSAPFPAVVPLQMELLELEASTERFKRTLDRHDRRNASIDPAACAKLLAADKQVDDQILKTQAQLKKALEAVENAQKALKDIETSLQQSRVASDTRSGKTHSGPVTGQAAQPARRSRSGS